MATSDPSALTEDIFIEARLPNPPAANGVAQTAVSFPATHHVTVGVPGLILHYGSTVAPVAGVLPASGGAVRLCRERQAHLATAIHLSTVRRAFGQESIRNPYPARSSAGVS